MSARAIRVALARAAVVVLVAGSVASAQTASVSGAQPPAPVTRSDSALDASTRALASQLRCPVCQGLSIQDSPSELAQQMRDLVRQQLGDGRTPDQVRQYFVSRYGQWILMAPPASGFNWVVYGLPPLVLIGGIAMLVMLVRRWTSETDQPPTDEALSTADR